MIVKYPKPSANSNENVIHLVMNKNTAASRQTSCIPLSLCRGSAATINSVETLLRDLHIGFVGGRTGALAGGFAGEFLDEH